MAAEKGNKYAVGNKGGRPKFVIDYSTVAKLAAMQCTQDEISSFLGCSTETLQRDKEFCAVYKKGMDGGKASLRRRQWEAVEKGNTTMLIWLGKQYLGQREPQHMQPVTDERETFNVEVTVRPKVI